MKILINGDIELINKRFNNKANLKVQCFGCNSALLISKKDAIVEPADSGRRLVYIECPVCKNKYELPEVG